MARTRIHGQQVTDGSIELVDLSSALASTIEGKADAGNLAPVATSGSYNDLTNLPTLFSGAYADLTGKPTLFSGDYADLSNKPSLFDGNYSSLSGAPVLSTVATSGSYNDLSNLPTLFSGSYTDLSNKPNFASVATSGSYNDLADKPSLFSGSYNDLTDAPSGVLVTTGYQLFSGYKEFIEMAAGSIETEFVTGKNNGVLNLRSMYPGAMGSKIQLSNGELSSRIDFYTKTTLYGEDLAMSVLSGGRVEMNFGASVFCADAAQKGMIVKAAASQTANLLEVQNSSSTAIFSVDKDGSLAAGTVPVARVSGLATVATSGSYNDLSDKPSIPSIVGLATETYVDTKVADLVASAPAVLDTLNELAAALGDDANFATTVAGQIGDVAGDVAALDIRVTAAEGDITSLQADVAAKADSASLAAVATSGSYNDLSNLPTLFSGAYADLTGKPTIPAALDDLSDVAVSSAVKGQFIVHNGTSFVNSNTIEASGAAVKPLIVKGAASQTANLFEAQNSSGTSLVSVESSGKVTLAGGGAGTCALAITGNMGDPSNIPTFTSSGIYAGTYPVAANDEQAWIRINSSNASYVGIIDFASTNTAYSSWRQRIGASATGTLEISTSNSANTDRNVVAEFNGWSNTKPSLRLTARSAAAQGLIVQGAASQTANLLEVQNSSGSVLCKVDNSGLLTSGGFSVISGGGLGVTGLGTGLTTHANQGVYLNSNISGYALMKLVGSAGRGWIDFTGPNVDYNGRLSYESTIHSFDFYTNASGIRVRIDASEADSGAYGTLWVNPAAAGRKGIVVKGAASQTANLFEAQNSSGTVLASISSAGAANFASTITAVGAINFGISGSGMSLSSSNSYNGVALGRGTSTGESGLALGSYVSCGSNAMIIGWGGGGTGRQIVGLSSGEVGIGTATPGAQLHAVTKATTMKGLVVQGVASQSANLFEVQNSSGTALFSIDKDGIMAAGAVPVARVTGLHAVATSGSYNDLADKPSIPSIAGLATETYVDTAVAAVVNSAPAVLDTLNELAAALGDDPNFATTMTTALASKADTSSLAAVATSGSYVDLSNKPTIYTPVKEVFTALVDGTETVFVLADAPAVAGTEQVFVNGILQSAGASDDYTISGDTITFNTAPEAGWKLIVYYFV